MARSGHPGRLSIGLCPGWYRTSKSMGGGQEGICYACSQPAVVHPHRCRGGVMNRTIRGMPARRLLRRVLPVAAAVLVGAGFAAGPAATAAVAAPAAPAAVAPSTTGGELGPNVYIFTPSMPQASIQSTLDSIANQQVSNQFGSQRYAILFEPGTYGSTTHPLIFQVGYYTTVAGLGLNPNDVTINGSIDVYNQCFGTGTNDCIALDNFWRSLSNLTINVAGGTGCQTATDFWA